jgi:hypothetical protein
VQQEQVPASDLLGLVVMVTVKGMMAMMMMMMIWRRSREVVAVGLIWVA